MNNVIVTALNVYPVKSLAGIALRQAVLTPRGIAHDRRFMLVKADGQFVTQRNLPALALIHTALDGEFLRLSQDGFGDIEVPLKSDDGDEFQTRVWKDECAVLDCGEDVSKWLTTATGSATPFRLVRMKPGFSRPQNRPERFGASTTTRFADAAPYLVCNEASLNALNQELLSRHLHAVPMNRFRPNIVVRGLDAFAEHHGETLSNGAITLKSCDPCERCVVPTIDQETGEKDPDWQPFKTLRDINPMPGNPRAPAFGQNTILTAGAGQTLRLGDTLISSQ